jgi:hypothetical protein
MADERRRRFLRRGSIPLFLHSVIEYGAGVLLIAAPFLFSFDSDVATAISILVGGGVLVIAVTTDYPLALFRRLPLDSHIVLDYVVAALLIASPFVFGFTDDAAAFAFFVILGIAHLLITVMTRFHKAHEH